jgi:serine protease Do
LPLGDSDRVRAGEWVLAVGSPFGLSGTVTSGIVSATGRNNMGINDYEDFIQTDAAINPGNSGGPLVNLHGQVIGINTAIFSRSGGYQGIGFAIPVNMAHDVCDQLIASGSVTRGYLGILIQPLTEELAKSFGLDNQEGVLIGDVTDGSPADKAGLQAGDVIVQFDGKDVAQVGTFRNLVAYTDPGSDVSVTVLRDGKRERITVEIGKLDSADEPAMAGESGPLPELGLSVQPLTDDVAQQLGYDAESGVVVTGVQPGSQAAEAGLKPGTLIKEVNRQPVGSVREFRDALAKNQDRGSVLLRVREGEFLRFVVLKLES